MEVGALMTEILRGRIINVRGTSGSGKTTAIRELMAQYVPGGTQTLYGESVTKPEGYRLVSMDESLAPLYVVGSYENVCGGCDQIKTQDEICDRVRRYSLLGDVVLEGLLMSHVYGRWAALADELQTSFIFAFLDTPEELCVQRVKDRRAARAEAKGVVLEPLNETNTRQKWKDNRRTYEKFRSSGHDARWLDHTRPGEILMQWLRSGK